MPTILCIDDDPAILQLQKNILEINAYTVLTAPDGPAGVALASKCPVDVVVLDFKMPGMDGAETAEALWHEQPDLPIVICTGFFDAVPEWLRWFAAAYLHKGDGPEALLSAIRALTSNATLPGEPRPKHRSLHRTAAA